MVPCGGHRSRQDGLRTVMGAGCTSLTGDGPGFRTIRGDGRRITTAAGCTLTAAGDGGLARLMAIRSIARSGRRRMFRSSALAADSGSVWVLDLDQSAGFHWALATSSIRGGVGGAVDTGLRGSANLIAAGLLRCVRDRDSRT